MPLVNESNQVCLLQAPSALASHLSRSRSGSADPEDSGYASYREDEGEEDTQMESFEIESNRKQSEERHIGAYAYRQDDASQLGQGAFGYVYRGRHLETGESVAVKQIPESQIKPGELRVLQAINSPFLVHFVGYHQDPQYTFLIMELCDTDLSQHIQGILTKRQIDIPSSTEFTSTPPETIRERGLQMQTRNLMVVMESLAKGYQTLYDEKIVHRDIKPQNILLKYFSTGGTNIPLIACAKLTDFGVSRILEDQSDQGLCNVAGTLLYMAPEIGANLLTVSQYDFKVDMWSIGCVLYQCLTGEAPFDEKSLCKLFLSAAGENYAAFRQPTVPHDTPDNVLSVLPELLEMDPRKRITPSSFHDIVRSFPSTHINHTS